MRGGDARQSQFDLVEIGDDGILLDRDHGGVYRLNNTAREIWTAFLAGSSTAEIARRLMSRFEIGRVEAERDVSLALEHLPATPSLPVDQRCRWQLTPQGYGFFLDDELAYETDGQGARLHPRLDHRPSAADAALHLRSLVTKLLSLRGVRVLHAAAVQVEGALIFLSGRSGAGKTTSARALERAGGRLVSEDLVVLKSDPPTLRAALDGEAAIRAWVSREAGALADDPAYTIDCHELDRCIQGPLQPIQQIVIVDAGRREGADIQLQPCARADALVLLIESIFFARNDAATWRDDIEWLRELVSVIPITKAVMPQGLDNLALAARAWLATLATTG